MENRLRLTVAAVLMTAAIPALAGSQNMTHSQNDQNNPQQLRQQYEQERARITGAGQLDTRSKSERKKAGRDGAFVHAPVNAERDQDNLQQLREEYEQKRDRITGADQLDTRSKRQREEDARDGAFLHAPVDTADAPDQRTHPHDDRSSW